MSIPDPASGDRPMIFSPPMVRALLREARQPGAGKHQTRRVLTRLVRFGAVTEFGRSDTVGYDWHFRDREMRWHDLRDARLREVLPYAPGNRIWVREAHYLTDDGDNECAVYACEEDDVREHLAEIARLPASFPEDVKARHLRLRPSILLPRWASRLTLIVEGVRVERLQDISRGDAIAEGITPLGFQAGFEMPGAEGGTRYDTARDAYAALWNSIHGPDAWAENPWVVALNFRVIPQNIDSIALEGSAP